MRSVRRVATAGMVTASALAWVASGASQAAPPAGPAADAIDAPLTATPGDAVRGRAIVANRQVGLCLLCHRGPFPEEHFQGTLAPDLAGAGARLSAGQLRLRLVDGRRVNPQTMMPSYARTDGFVRVGKPWAGRQVLEPQQIEDVVAFLETLK